MKNDQNNYNSSSVYNYPYPHFNNQRLNKYLPQKSNSQSYSILQKQIEKQKNNMIPIQQSNNKHNKNNYRKSLEKRLERLFKQQKDMINQRYSFNNNNQVKHLDKQQKDQINYHYKHHESIQNQGLQNSFNRSNLNVQKMELKIKLLQEKYDKINKSQKRKRQSLRRQRKKQKQIQNPSQSSSDLKQNYTTNKNQQNNFNFNKTVQKRKSKYQDPKKPLKQKSSRLNIKKINTKSKNIQRLKTSSQQKLIKQVQLLKQNFQQIKQFYQYLLCKNQEKQKKRKKNNQCKLLLEDIVKKLQLIKKKIFLKNKFQFQQNCQQQQSNKEKYQYRPFSKSQIGKNFQKRNVNPNQYHYMNMPKASIQKLDRVEKRLIYQVQDLNIRLKRQILKRQQAEKKAQWAIDKLDQMKSQVQQFSKSKEKQKH